MKELKRQIAFWLINLVVLRWLLAELMLAESSILWTTGTTGDGATTYTEAQSTSFWGDWLTPNATITNPNASQGVLAGVGGELAVTGASSPVSVAAGGAIVEGYPYRSTAAVSVAIPTPAASTRIDRIVLRVSHSTTRTVRVTRIAGTEGAGAPSLTQTAGTTWDIPLAQASITTGGVITLTDQRTFAHFATRIDKNQVDGMTAGYLPFADSNGRLTQDASGGPYWDDANNRFAIGTTTPTHQIQAYGAGQSVAALTDAGATGGSFYARDTGASSGNGGAYYVGEAHGWWAAIKGMLTNGTGPLGDLVFALRKLTTDTALTEVLRLTAAGLVGVNNASPSKTLDVTGTLGVSGQAIVGAAGSGGVASYSATINSGTAQTILAAAAVNNSVQYMWAVKQSTGGGNNGQSGGLCGGGGGHNTDLYNAGGTNVLQLQCGSDGSIKVQRTAGSLTYIVSLWICFA